MSSGGSIAYRLRPNKAVDRELFISLLSRIAATLKIEGYQYVGLGGAFLGEFRLLHARLGISDMVCIEQEESVHERQKFNRPISSIRCIHADLEDYLSETEFSRPIILWLDYTRPDEIRNQIESFCSQLTSLPLNSIVKVTLNANPSSLGKPDPMEVGSDLFPDETEGRMTLHEWRLEKLRIRLGEHVPTEFSSEQLHTRNFGPALLQILNMAIERSLEGYSDRKVVRALATHYSDGQPMITLAVIIAPRDDEIIEKVIDEWSFHSDGNSPIQIDLPALSAKERLTLEASEDPKKCLSYELPKSSLKSDPVENFKILYRVFPHFTTVDL